MHHSRALSLGCLTAALALIAAPLQAQEANFGSAVASTGNQAFVGEPLNEYTPGAVYMYSVEDGGHWQLAAKLQASDASNHDGFGHALAAEGSTLLVSASTADSGRGAVYLFTSGGAGSWQEASKFTAPARMKGTQFGSALALEGDLLLASTSTRDSTAGTVYAYRRSGDSWKADGELSPADVEPGDSFGNALAIEGERAFVGAFGQDSAQGAVYVFARDSLGHWTQESKFTLRQPQPHSGFGYSIVPHGDEVYVGSPGSFSASGAIYPFHYDAAVKRWMQGPPLLPFDGGPALFGLALAFDGNSLLAGAPAAGRRAGRIYLIERDSSSDVWVSASKFGAAADSVSGAFGATISISGTHGVVGLPSADFGMGRAALVSRTADGSWKIDQLVYGDNKGLAAITGSKVDCSAGKAKIFDCQGVDLLSFLPVSDIGGTRGVVLNDIWGWTDPETSREYALVGRADGTSFVDVTDPLNPRYLGSLPKTATANSAVWRDIKVYRNHAFVVADGAGEHGMQVFDLTRLRNVEDAPVTFDEDAHYDRIHSAHNIVIDTATGFAYTVGNSSGGETCGGGLHMIDIHDPLHPGFAGCFADPTTGRSGTGYIHDAQCVVYHGPAERFHGRELCLNASETALGIADVTDKKNPVALSHVAYPNVGYAHQGWLTEDQRYFYMDDELDELQGKSDGTRTLIWDVSDPTDPILVGQYVSKDKSSDHNLYIVGDTMYQSNYVSGLRVLDIKNRKEPTQVGYFDTVPSGPDKPGFDGSWSNYPFFKSGTIIVTSMKEGLFMLREHQAPLIP